MLENILAQQAKLGQPVTEVWSIDLIWSGETPLHNPKGFVYGEQFWNASTWVG